MPRFGSFCYGFEVANFVQQLRLVLVGELIRVITFSNGEKRQLCVTGHQSQHPKGYSRHTASETLFLIFIQYEVSQALNQHSSIN